MVLWHTAPVKMFFFLIKLNKKKSTGMICDSFHSEFTVFRPCVSADVSSSRRGNTIRTGPSVNQFSGSADGSVPSSSSLIDHNQNYKAGLAVTAGWQNLAGRHSLVPPTAFLPPGGETTCRVSACNLLAGWQESVENPISPRGPPSRINDDETNLRNTLKPLGPWRKWWLQIIRTIFMKV